MAARSWTTADTEKLRELHAQGLTLTAIAKAMGRSKSMVSKYAADASLSFDRSQVQAATAARVVDTKARRVEALDNELEILLLTQRRVLATMRDGELWDTILRGEMGSEHEARTNVIPMRDLREATNARSGSAAIIDRLTDTSEGTDDAKSVLGAIATAIKTAAAVLPA